MQIVASAAPVRASGRRFLSQQQQQRQADRFPAVSSSSSSRCFSHRPPTLEQRLFSTNYLSSASCSRSLPCNYASRSSIVARSASSAGASPSSSTNGDENQGGLSPAALAQAAKVFAVAVAAAALTIWKGGYGPSILRAIDASILSGAVPAFSLVFLSELGDKTFFLAALLAARAGRRVAFVGSVAALAVMSAVSAAIGAAAQRVPETLVSSSLPVSKWASVALLAYFGIRTLRAAWDAAPDAAGEELAAAREELGEDGDDDDGAAAKKKQKKKRGDIDRDSSSALARTLEVGTIIFLAEWGDRSMLATIALAAAQGPLGVAAGATAGHALATAIAVLGGALVSRWLSERAIGFIGGGLFLVFAALTQAGVM